MCKILNYFVITMIYSWYICYWCTYHFYPQNTNFFFRHQTKKKISTSSGSLLVSHEPTALLEAAYREFDRSPINVRSCIPSSETIKLRRRTHFLSKSPLFTLFPSIKATFFMAPESELFIKINSRK
jgi:hypothetical protein